MTYATTFTLLQTAISCNAKYLKIETDPGTLKYTLEEAIQLWDELCPGEPFVIRSIEF